MIEQTGALDIIIDDGSHINEHVKKSVEILFPYLKENGIYIIEDTQTSYLEEFGGNSIDLLDPKTLMNYFKYLVDGLNYMEIKNNNDISNYFSKNIKSIHFYHNLIFIYKGENNEVSNMMDQ